MDKICPIMSRPRNSNMATASLKEIYCKKEKCMAWFEYDNYCGCSLIGERLKKKEE